MIKHEDSVRYLFRKYFVDSSTKRGQQLINSVVYRIRDEQNTTRPIGERVANAIDQEVNSSVYFQRLLIGGKHNLEKVVKNASCFDIAVFTEKILTNLGIRSEKNNKTSYDSKTLLHCFGRWKCYRPLSKR